jgi:hypothetical protein
MDRDLDGQGPTELWIRLHEEPFPTELVVEGEWVTGAGTSWWGPCCDWHAIIPPCLTLLQELTWVCWF